MSHNVIGNVIGRPIDICIQSSCIYQSTIGKFQKAIESGSFDFGRGLSREDLGVSLWVYRIVH